MNRSIVLLTVLLTVSLQYQSCNDDESPTVTTHFLEGTWAAVSYEATETYYYRSVGQVATFGHSVEGFDLDYEISFQEDTYTTEGSYFVDIWTTDNNGSFFENDSLFQSDVSISGDYLATETALAVDRTFFKLILESTDLSEASVDQTTDYEMDPTETELIIHQSLEYVTDSDNGPSDSVIIISTSVWRKL